MSDSGKYYDKASGTAKEKAGEALDDDSLKAEGAYDKAKGKAKDAADQVRDKAEEVKDQAKEKSEEMFGGDDNKDSSR